MMFTCVRCGEVAQVRTPTGPHCLLCWIDGPDDRAYVIGCEDIVRELAEIHSGD